MRNETDEIADPWDTFLQKQLPSSGSPPGAASRPDTNRARMEPYYTAATPVWHGPDHRCILATDRPRMVEGELHDVCGIHFPGLGSG
jgi:hypothetical protein